jgi:hypothetical protein
MGETARSRGGSGVSARRADSLRPVRGGVRMRTIRPYLALMKKDFGSIAEVAIFLLLLTVVVTIYTIIRRDVLYLQHVRLITFIPIFRWYIGGIVYMLTSIFIYSMNIEPFDTSSYTSLSLPIRKYWFILSKFIVITMVGFCIYFFHYIIGLLPLAAFVKLIMVHALHYQKSAFPSINPDLLFIPPRYRSIDVIWIFYIKQVFTLFVQSINYLRELILCLGLACLAQGITCMVKRYRFFVWSGVFIVGVLLFNNAVNYLFAVFIQQKGLFLQESDFPLYYVYSPLILGLIFLVVGLFLFEKYSEA